MSDMTNARKATWNILTVFSLVCLFSFRALSSLVSRFRRTSGGGLFLHEGSMTQLEAKFAIWRSCLLRQADMSDLTGNELLVYSRGAARYQMALEVIWGMKRKSC